MWWSIFQTSSHTILSTRKSTKDNVFESDLYSDWKAAHLWLDGFEHRSVHKCDLALEETNTTPVRTDMSKSYHTDKISFFTMYVEYIYCTGSKYHPSNDSFTFTHSTINNLICTKWRCQMKMLKGKEDRECPLVAKPGIKMNTKNFKKSLIWTIVGKSWAAYKKHLLDFKEHYSSKHSNTNLTEMWLHNQAGEILQTLIITDANSDPISSSIIPSPPVQSQHITFVLTEHFIFKNSCIQVNQTVGD